MHPRDRGVRESWREAAGLTAAFSFFCLFGGTNGIKVIIRPEEEGKKERLGREQTQAERHTNRDTKTPLTQLHARKVFGGYTTYPPTMYHNEEVGK